MSHLVLDWTNSYGVHPFWPVDDRWRYGDAVFIVEPWLWVVSVPTLFLGTRNRLGRVLLALVLFGGLALSWRVALVSRGAATALTIGAVLSVAVALLLRSGTRVMVAIAGWVAVTLVMAAGTSIARAEASGSVHASDPTAELLDIVVSPLPSNAICASVITVERAGAIYRVAVARVTAVPSIVGAAHCGVRDATASMLTPSTRTSTPAVQWDGEWSAPSAELVALARESCVALAALRFIRVPIWRSQGDSVVFLSDVRYGGASGDGFASVWAPRRPTTCPDAIPPWLPPRADVLGEYQQRR